MDSSFNLFRSSTKMSNFFVNHNVFSASRLSEARKVKARFSLSGAYNQEAFRYLLESESKRSERSGNLCQILLMYSTDAQGRIVLMDSHVAKAVIVASSRSLRETDYIGWYRDGHIVGAVLTVLGQETLAQVATHLQPRLVEIILADLGVEETSRLRIRVCQHHELNGIEFEERTFAVN